MKVGRSEQARVATVSHTASLAGSDAASDAFLKRLDISRVDTIPSFLETLKLLHAVGPLASYTLSSMSCSGLVTISVFRLVLRRSSAAAKK